MSEYCSACEDLKEYAPNFMLNGITDKECNSLQNNTGLNPDLDVLHSNCEDLNDLLDCLLGALQDKLPAYDDCDWKAFVSDLISNIYSLQNAIICSECGLWTALEKSSYVGVGTLSTNSTVSECLINDTGILKPAFRQFEEQSNLPSGIITPTADKKGIIVNNTTDVPFLVNSTFNCSIFTDQILAMTYIVVTRDGKQIGQTPFFAADTYDSQVSGEPFVLQPGQSTTLSYYLGVGSANLEMLVALPQLAGGRQVCCSLEPHDPDPAVQRSYFNVAISSIMGQKTSYA